MQQEQMVIVAFDVLVFTLVALVLGMTLRLALKAPEPEPPVLLDDPDFEKFYLDLHRYARETDYTREETERLYRVWQRSEKVTN